jgi:hypothetical protein
MPHTHTHTHASRESGFTWSPHKPQHSGSPYLRPSRSPRGCGLLIPRSCADHLCAPRWLKGVNRPLQPGCSCSRQTTWLTCVFGKRAPSRSRLPTRAATSALPVLTLQGAWRAQVANEPAGLWGPAICKPPVLTGCRVQYSIASPPAPLLILPHTHATSRASPHLVHAPYSGFHACHVPACENCLMAMPKWATARQHGQAWQPPGRAL